MSTQQRKSTNLSKAETMRHCYQIINKSLIICLLMMFSLIAFAPSFALAQNDREDVQRALGTNGVLLAGGANNVHNHLKVKYR